MSDSIQVKINFNNGKYLSFMGDRKDTSEYTKLIGDFLLDYDVDSTMNFNFRISLSDDINFSELELEYSYLHNGGKSMLLYRHEVETIDLTLGLN